MLLETILNRVHHNHRKEVIQMEEKNKTTQPTPDENGNIVGEATMEECSNGRGANEDEEDL
jgi:hypothetical protein